MKQLIKWIDFSLIGDERGNLISIEGNKNIPFEIKRVYYLFGMQPELPRGFHAHKQLIQAAVCLQGQCEILMDNGKESKTVTLKSPNQALMIDTMQWHEMSNFSKDCILLVLANDIYDESDYIRDYEHFIKEVKNENSSFK